jgi:hypothetical protein
MPVNATSDVAISSTDAQLPDNAALIGGIVGGIIALLLVGGLIAFVVARNRRRDNNNGVASTTAPSNYDRIPTAINNSDVLYDDVDAVRTTVGSN